MTVLSNKYKTSVTVHYSANVTITVAGNNSVSNLATSDETLTGCVIDKVIYGSGGGTAPHWVVKRNNGSTNSVIMVLSESGFVEFDGLGMQLSAFRDGDNIQLELVGTANGYIMMDLKKLGVNPNA